MPYNLKNRSFVKEIDFEPGELRYLLRLTEALKLAKYAGTETRRLDGKETRSSSTRHRRAPGRPSRSPPMTRVPTSPTSTRPAHRWATRNP
jgi:hypothetical protein